MRIKTAFMVLCLLSVSVLPVYAEGTTTGNGTPTKNQKDASSDIRRKQVQSDIRARLQRAKTTGKLTNSDVENIVRDKLEVNLQKRSLNVKADNGAVTLEGKVGSQAEADKAVRLTKGMPGVKSVNSKLVIGS